MKFIVGALLAMALMSLNLQAAEITNGETSKSAPVNLHARMTILDVSVGGPNSLAQTTDVCTVNDFQVVDQLLNEYGPVFEFKGWDNYGPDAEYRMIVMLRQGKTLILNSWHPLIEKNETLVVTSRGVELLNGKKRSEALKTDDKSYIKQREAFDAIVSTCIAKAVQKLRH